MAEELVPTSLEKFQSLINNDKTTYWGANTLFLESFLKKQGFQLIDTRLIYKGYRCIIYASNKDINKKIKWGEW